jgi:hypothetical protein
MRDRRGAAPGALVGLAVLVDADDDALARVDLGLQLEGGVGDLALGVVLLDRGHHAAQLVDLGEVVVGLALELVGQRLDEVRPRRAGRWCSPRRSRGR